MKDLVNAAKAAERSRRQRRGNFCDSIASVGYFVSTNTFDKYLAFPHNYSVRH